MTYLLTEINRKKPALIDLTTAELNRLSLGGLFTSYSPFSDYVQFISDSLQGYLSDFDTDKLFSLDIASGLATVALFTDEHSRGYYRSFASVAAGDGLWIVAEAITQDVTNGSRVLNSYERILFSAVDLTSGSPVVQTLGQSVSNLYPNLIDTNLSADHIFASGGDIVARHLVRGFNTQGKFVVFESMVVLDGATGEILVRPLAKLGIADGDVIANDIAFSDLNLILVWEDRDAFTFQLYTYDANLNTYRPLVDNDALILNGPDVAISDSYMLVSDIRGRLWRVDEDGVATMLPQPASLEIIREAWQLGEYILFSAHNADAAGDGIELWLSDSTAQGTFYLGDLSPGSNPYTGVPYETAVQDAEVFGAGVLFSHIKNLTYASFSTGEILWEIPVDTNYIDDIAVSGDAAYFVSYEEVTEGAGQIAPSRVEGTVHSLDADGNSTEIFTFEGDGNISDHEFFLNGDTLGIIVYRYRGDSYVLDSWVYPDISHPDSFGVVKNIEGRTLLDNAPIPSVLPIAFSGTGGGDKNHGFSGNDRLFGKGGNDTLSGGNGNDTIYGGAGSDIMLGGAGNDSYFVNDAGDAVFETTSTASLVDAGGIDVVQSAVSFNLDASVGVRFVENLVLIGTTDINGTGNALANRLMGNVGNNVLNGGLGNDTMIGGLGNDTFIVNSAGDRVVEARTARGGFDWVESAVTFNLDANSGVRFVENLVLTGTADIDGIGNELVNRLIGNAGNNVLDGAFGKDIMVGGAGNDTYKVDSAGDSIFESMTTTSTIDAGGMDVVRSTVTFSLDTSVGVRFVENLMLIGNSNINGTGNMLANRLTGNAGNNVLNGGLGNDTMIGGAGGDTFAFSGAFGNDRVIGFDRRQVGELIDVSAIAEIGGFSDLVANHLVQRGTNAVIMVGSNTISLDGVWATTLSSDDFIF